MRGQAFLFSAPGLAWISLEETAGGSSGPWKNWDLVGKPSCKFSPLSRPIFLPASLSPQDNRKAQEGFLSSWASWGRRGALPLVQALVIAGTPPGPGPAPPPPSPPQGGAVTSAALLSLSPSVGEASDTVPEKTCSSWRRSITFDSASYLPLSLPLPGLEPGSGRDQLAGNDAWI